MKPVATNIAGSSMNASPVHTHCWDAVGMMTDLVEAVEILVFKADVEMVLLVLASVTV